MNIRKEIQEALELKRNPLSDQRSFKEARERLSLYNLNTMSLEERQAISEIFR